MVVVQLKRRTNIFLRSVSFFPYLPPIPLHHLLTGVIVEVVLGFFELCLTVSLLPSNPHFLFFFSFVPSQRVSPYSSHPFFFYIHLFLSFFSSSHFHSPILPIHHLPRHSSSSIHIIAPLPSLLPSFLLDESTSANHNNMAKKYGTTAFVRSKWPLMLRLKGTVILTIWWQVLLMGIYSVAVALIHDYTAWKMNYSLSLVSVMGMVVSLLLVFRTNTGTYRFVSTQQQNAPQPTPTTPRSFFSLSSPCPTVQLLIMHVDNFNYWMALCQGSVGGV